MKNECNYVRDILPLYLENMVSEQTREFVKEHLEHCPECVAELEALVDKTDIEKFKDNIQDNLDDEVIKSIKKTQKKVNQKARRVAAFIAVIFIVICILLHFFPVYRIVTIGPKYYSHEQIEKALYIGSASDRGEAQAVLRLADEAFNDIEHTSAENEQRYGQLARYATNTDYDGNTAFNEHSLELWSAHLKKNHGWIWVYYSSETFNHDGSIACGSSQIPSLWEVEKNKSGEWVVVQIYEQP